MSDFNMHDFMKYSCSTKKCVTIFFKIKLRHIDDVHRHSFPAFHSFINFIDILYFNIVLKKGRDF